jgi:DHA1 family bicyclomycin/chloramphenicol resistance-like MFS transporter
VTGAAPEHKSRVPGWLMLIASMSAVGPVSIDMYLPGFESIVRDFSERGVETTMAAYLIGLAIGQLFYGPISDRYGRKPPLYVGFGLYALGSLGCALSTSMSMLVLMRIVQALGGCGGLVIARAIVRDRCEPHEAARVFSTLMMIVALGPVLAPAVGGFIVTWFGWRATFVFQVLFGIGVLVAIHYVLTETVNREQAMRLEIGGVLRTYWRLLRDRMFVGYTMITGFSMAALFCYVTGAPTVMTAQYGLSARQFGLLIGLNGLAFMTASRLNMIALRRHGPGEVLVRYVYTPMIVVTLLLGLTLIVHPPLWAFVALQLTFFVSVGRVNPNVAALALAPHGRDAGAASAIMGALQSAAGVLGGLTVGAFNDGTVVRLVQIMAAGAFLGLLSYLSVRPSIVLQNRNLRS